MKIIVIGATGVIGQAVVNELASRHDVIRAARNKADIDVDITDSNSIEKMYKKIDSFDAVISTTGKVHFDELAKMTPELYSIGLNNKLMGQINVVLIGQRFINQKGSFTLTSGILNQDPIRLGSSAAMVNGAIDGFVKSAALELAHEIRINAISPTIVSESMEHYAEFFRGFESVPAARVALAYSKSVEGNQTGQIYRVGY